MKLIGKNFINFVLKKLNLQLIFDALTKFANYQNFVNIPNLM